MKKLVSIFAVSLLLSACGTQVKYSELKNQQTISSEAAVIAAQSGRAADIWGTEGSWSTTPDGYPVW